MEILNASKNKFNCLVGKDINIIRCEDLISKRGNLFETPCLRSWLFGSKKCFR